MGRTRLVGAIALVVVGAVLIVAWAVSFHAVRNIENGTAGDRLVGAALESPQVAEIVADEVDRVLRESVDSPAGQAALVLLEGQIRDAVMAVASSDLVSRLITEGGARVQDRLLTEVSDPDREPAPFTLDIDLSERVNARVAEIPVIGGALPAVTLPSLSVEVMSEQAFEDLRSLVSVMTAIANWGLWLGLAAIAGAVALSPRWRVFGSRALGVVGVSLAVVALILGSIGPATLASIMPGGRDGAAGVLIEDVLGAPALAPIAELLLAVGVAGVALAVGWALAERGVGRAQGRGAGGGTAGGAVDLRTTSS